MSEVPLYGWFLAIQLRFAAPESFPEAVPSQGIVLMSGELQGYLAHKKQPPPSTIQ